MNNVGLQKQNKIISKKFKRAKPHYIQNIDSHLIVKSSEIYGMIIAQIQCFFWSVFSLIHSEKYGPEKTPYLDTFYAVRLIPMAKDTLGKGALKICSKCIGEHPCRSVISARVLSCKFAAFFQNRILSSPTAIT